MADEGVPTTPAGVVTWSVDDPIVAAVREVLAAMPSGCSWLLPVTQDGEVVDFGVAATSEQGRDVYGRGAGRVGGLLSALYPGMVGGVLWQTY
ncbi:phosphatase, partial [Micromonospora sp. U56]|nr:phosphatase [Micromonospora sp. U56]